MNKKDRARIGSLVVKLKSLADYEARVAGAYELDGKKGLAAVRRGESYAYRDCSHRVRQLLDKE